MIRSKTPQEIREEYERISKEREEKRIESLTHSQVGFFFYLCWLNDFGFENEKFPKRKGQFHYGN